MMLWIGLLLCLILMAVTMTAIFVIMFAKGWAFWTCSLNAIAAGVMIAGCAAYGTYKVNSGDPRWRM